LRKSIAHFAEVQLTCPDASCEAREQAVRWCRAPGTGQGTSPASEPAIEPDYGSLRAELTVDTEVQHVWSAAADVLLLVERLRRSAERAAHAGRLSVR